MTKVIRGEKMRRNKTSRYVAQINVSISSIAR